MLTLDEPDRTPHATTDSVLPVTIDDLQQMREVFGTVREWFALADRVPPADPDRLYRAHGEPRD